MNEVDGILKIYNYTGFIILQKTRGENKNYKQLQLQIFYHYIIHLIDIFMRKLLSTIQIF